MLEDDKDDIDILKTFLEEVKYNVLVEYISKPDQMFALLEAGKKPAMVLLDYNFGPEEGMETLKKLKQHPDYKSIPVVVLSDNSQAEFVVESYANGACSFI